MATAFRRKGSRVVGRMDVHERELVVSLLQQTRELLGGDDHAGTGDPLQDLLGSLGAEPLDPEEVAGRDPALQRLLPPASRDDERMAADFRAMTEGHLRQQKTATLATAIVALGGDPGAAPGADLEDRRGDTVELDLGQAQSLMRALTDVRLVLAERLELRTDEDSEQLHAMLEDAEDIEDPRMLLAAYYDFLTWLQESVTLAIMRR
ncbi:DUF2017 domain-containing protein [Luteipulveratus sp. YIM 133132]|uniref:DUF2017 domain-containing protein n=1 Tax=Luteipulveratus flavus TaxID=3031728 RepID=A0ABT6C621_9MICO|nr:MULTISPECIES: DUF2017 domain-containing protein [unclassified Luteipulveratus]MDE9367829.1 DUF2017 domain-containing protein [Luteipulveratus sp. YIM 133132]MDF8263757.1 DUF2017 domain-containing protein [Luteipulveratus sp. YIM 133296]